MTKRAYVVTGPVSTGNRLIASYLVRAGCDGSGSTHQFTDKELEKGGIKQPVVIRHSGDLQKVLNALKNASYEIQVVISVREESALLKSQVDHGFFDTRGEALEHLRWSYPEIFLALISCRITDHMIVSLESLILHPIPVVDALLRRLNLPTEQLLDSIDVDMVEMSPIPNDANAKHYADMPQPLNRIAHAKELIWYPERGMGHYPVANFPAAYDESYWEKYKSYEDTDVGRGLTDFRVGLVKKYLPGGYPLTDIGIGSGQFLKARPDTTGYDVNPSAIKWLKDIDAWLNPFEESVDSITCWDSLEHFADPARLISRVRGFVFISIPIFRDAQHCLESKHFRRDEHFWYFTEAGLLRWLKGRGFTCLYKTPRETELGREGIMSYVFKRRA